MGNESVLIVIKLALLVFGLYFVAKFLYGLMAGQNNKSKYCMTCGHEGGTRTHTRGHILIEIILWLCFIVPGLIYSIWRISTRHEACNNCGAANVVPPQSPVVRAAKARMEAPQG